MMTLAISAMAIVTPMQESKMALFGHGDVFANADTVVVTSADGLRAAIKDAQNDRVVVLDFCTDSIGYYNLGKAGFDYPQKFINLAIRPANKWIIVYGSFQSKSATTRMKLKTLAFDEITFKAELGKDLDEMYNPFYITSNDSVMNAMIVVNCKFINLGVKTRILRVNAASKSVVKKFIFSGNYIENFGGNLAEGVHGQTFMQWNSANPGYEFDDITISDNSINGWHGNQFFNWGRQRVTTPDSLIKISINNNIFYKFGGNGTSARNFVEWTNNMGGVKANININENIFYKNWETNHYKIFRLHLFTPKDSIQRSKVVLNVVDNYFENDDVALMSPYTQNLPITNGDLTYTSYKALTKASLGTNQSIFADENEGLLSKFNPIFTAASDGSNIGPANRYSDMTVPTRSNAEIIKVNTLAGLKNAVKNAIDGDVIELQNCIDAVGYYNLGSTGIPYPAKFANLTIKNAEGNVPVLFGTFKSMTSKMKLKTYTLDGLTFDASNKTDSEGSAPIYMLASDSILTSLNIKNCKFINMGKAGGGRIIDAASDKAVVKLFTFENNIIDNFGYTSAPKTHGQTFMQWRDNGAYEFDNIVLRNNVIHNWHGNQFINMSRKKSTNPDSTLNITFENNTLYKFGGNGTSARNFIEWGNKVAGLKAANINISNNLFYKNWDATGHRSGIIRLYTESDSIVRSRIKVNAQKNFFFTDSVLRPAPATTYTQNLPLVNTNITYANYSALTMSDLGLTTSPFIDEAKADSTHELFIARSNPLYKAGLNGKFIGSKLTYNIREIAKSVYVKNMAELKAAIESAADGDQIKLENCNDSVGYYNLGSTGLDYPDYFVNLTISPATGNSPVVFGTFKSKTSKMKLKSFVIDGLTFDATNKSDAEGCAPIYMLPGDSIMSILNIKNCSFINLGKSGGGRVVDASSDKAVVKMFVFEKNIVENFGAATAPGAHGQTFMQWRNSGSYEFDNIVLKNNTFHNWHGNQFLNNGRKTTTNPDGTMNITVENNTFYRFGGNGTSARNFIEWANKMTGVTAANINVNNNLFYKNWDEKNHRSGGIKLYEETDEAVRAKFSINAYCNFFYKDTVMQPAPFTTFTMNLPILGSTTLKYSGYRAFTATYPGIPNKKYFVNESKADTTLDLTMYKQSILTSIGFGGTCIGDPRWYTNEEIPPTILTSPLSLEKAIAGNVNIYSVDKTLFVKGAQKSITLYNTIGQKIGVYSVEDADMGISIKTKGLIIVNCDGQTTRVMIK